ncbi:MAG TPA: NAD-dependent epimerase/dehydratase family protein [Armatimonadota bacterium]|nr:NAD-dependent epimerase/dehydratase family protein [Armatimonadota bacterium]
MKQALVTGGCGFVGRHVVMRLLGMGLKVWAVDNLSTGQHPDAWMPKDYVDSGAFVFVEDDARKFFARYLGVTEPARDLPDFDDVFHFAAVVGGRVKIDGDPIAVANDLAIDSDMFTWAVRVRPGRILFASSSAAYPIDLQASEGAVALKEADINFGGRLGQPDMTYGWSKLTGEYLARIAAQHYDLRVACVRPFSGYGEDQDLTYPIPAMAARAARRENPFEVWGSGDQGRDFVHIEDCVDAMLLALDKISDGSGVNIGSGTLTTFKEVIRIFCGFAGYEPTIKPLLDKPVGVHSRYADVTVAREILGFTPKISINEGLRRVYEAALKRI